MIFHFLLIDLAKSRLFLIEQKKSKRIFTTWASPYTYAVKCDLSLYGQCLNCFQYNLIKKQIIYLNTYNTIFSFPSIQFNYRYVVICHFTWVPGSMTFNGTKTCLQESLGRAGEVQISTRPMLLFSRTRSSDPLAATGARYQNSRQASPSSPSGPLSKIFTETCKM